MNTLPKNDSLSRGMLCVAAIIAVVNCAMLWTVSDRTFPFVDEGMYLFSMLAPHDFPASLSGFGYLLHPLYVLLDGDVVALKRATVIINALCNSVLAASLGHWLAGTGFAGQLGISRSRVTLSLALLFIAGGAWLGDGVPSYNTANVWLCTLFIATAVTVIARRARHWGLWSVALSLLLGLALFVKWPSAVCLFGVWCLACLAGLGVNATTISLLATVLTLTGAAGAAIYSAAGSRAMEVLFLVMGDKRTGYGLGRVLSEAAASVGSLIFVGGIATLVSWNVSSWVSGRFVKPIPQKVMSAVLLQAALPLLLALGMGLVADGAIRLWQIAMATAVAHATWMIGTAAGLKVGTRRDPDAFALVASWDRRVFSVRGTWEKERLGVAVGLMLILAPFAVSGGTSPQVLASVTNGGSVFFLGALAVLMLRAKSSRMNYGQSAAPGLIACCLAAEAAFVSQNVLWPYDRNQVHPPAVWEKVHRVPHLARGGGLRFDAPTQEALALLNRQWLQATKGNPSQPAIAPYPMSSSLPYLLGALMPGAPGYYWAGASGAEQVKRNWPSWMAGRAPYVIRYRDTNFQPEVLAVLADKGVRFPEDYVLASKTKFLSNLTDSNPNLAYSIEIWAPKSAGIIR